MVINRCFEESVKILEENRALLDEIANYLLIKETITGAEMMSIINNETPVSIEETDSKTVQVSLSKDEAVADDTSAPSLEKNADDVPSSEDMTESEETISESPSESPEENEDSSQF